MVIESPLLAGAPDQFRRVESFASLCEIPDNHEALSHPRHKKRPRDAVAPDQTHLPEFSVQMLDVGFAQADQPRLAYALTEPDKARPQIRRKLPNLCAHGIVQNLDRPSHAISISFLR